MPKINILRIYAWLTSNRRDCFFSVMYYNISIKYHLLHYLVPYVQIELS